MVHWWAADLWARNPVLLISWTFWCFFSVTLHELGGYDHGGMAQPAFPLLIQFVDRVTKQDQ